MANKQTGKSHFWSSLSQDISYLFKLVKARLLRPYRLAMTEKTSEQNGQKNTAIFCTNFQNKGLVSTSPIKRRRRDSNPGCRLPHITP